MRVESKAGAVMKVVSLSMWWLLLKSQSLLVDASFASPVGFGVKWRYWVEDGGVNATHLASDFASMVSIGSSGVELLSYQSYGFPVPDAENIADTGYGSEQFKQLIDTAADVAVTYNLTLDIAAGPSQGAGIPAKNPDVDGYNTELAFGFIVVKQGFAFHDALPAPIIFPMLKYGGSFAPAFNVTTSRLQAVILAALAPSANTSAATILLDFASVVDVSSNVTASTMNNSSLSLSLSPVATDSVIVAFYSRRNGYQEAYGSTHASDNLPASWGAFIVDHFSSQGADTIDNFTQSYLFSPVVKESFAKAGRLIWEDSMEFRAQLFWTPLFMQRFAELRGYSAVTALPAFYSRVRAPFQGQNLPPQVFAFTDNALNARFAFDYCDTLTALYMEYVATRNAFSRRVGFHLSLQPGYGFSVDIGAAASMVDVPEIESLGFRTVDACRQVSGGVHLAGANVLSTELGAVMLEAYSQTMSEIVKLAHVQFAGGVNVVVIHGFPYNGPVSLTTWPGLTTFSFVYAEMHGPRQPGWSQYSGYMKHLARTQYVLQKGSVAKVDLAIYRHDFDSSPVPVFSSNVLQLAGYTYEYLSPYNLQLPRAIVTGSNGNQRLSAFDDGPAYKALILVNQTTMVAAAAMKILTLAQAGLRVIIIGVPPSDIPGYEPTINNTNTTKKNMVVAAMQALVTLPNVRQVKEYADVPAALTALGIRPAAALISSSAMTDQVFSVRRSEITTSTNSRVDYYWLYNSGSVAVNLTMNFETASSNGWPFEMDTWTGAVHALVPSNRLATDVVQLQGIYLFPEQTRVFAFTNATDFEGIAVAASNVNATAVTFSNTAAVAVAPSTSISTVPLNSWTLEVTAYTPPTDLSNYQSVLVKKGPIELGSTLTAWNSLPTLAGNYTSGRGAYTTTFSLISQWEPSTSIALLDLSGTTGATEHIVSVSLNGQRVVDAVDPATQRVELPSKLLVVGNNNNNTLVIEIATTLLNAMNTVAPTRVLSVGGNRLSGLPFVPPSTTNGIQGTIKLLYFAIPNSSNAPTLTPTSAPTLMPTPKVGEAVRVKSMGLIGVVLASVVVMVMITI